MTRSKYDDYFEYAISVLHDFKHYTKERKRSAVIDISFGRYDI